jgi:hypothetical protein
VTAAELDPIRLAVAAGGALTLVAVAVAVARGRRRRARPVVHPPAAEPCAEHPAPGTRSSEVLALFGELRPGSTLDGWRIAGIYEDDRGCVPVLLAGPDGTRFRIDVLRRDPESPPPPAETEKLALYLSGMRAGSRTPDDCQRGALALATALASVGAEPPRWLLTMRDRAVRLREPRRPS